jgi:hypothetical protein
MWIMTSILVAINSVDRRRIFDTKASPEGLEHSSSAEWMKTRSMKLMSGDMYLFDFCGVWLVCRRD